MKSILKVLFVIFSSCLFSASYSFASFDFNVNPENPDIPIEVIPSHKALIPGEKGTLAVVFDIPWGFHIQDDFDIKLSGAEGIETVRIIKPEGKYDETVDMVFYYGKNIFAVEFNVRPDTVKGTRKITAKILYSPCTEELCIGRFDKDIEFNLIIGDANIINPEFENISDYLPVNIIEPESSVQSRSLPDESFENKIAGAIEKRSWFVFLLVFLGGIATSLTPCVFPMIPVTVSFFGTRTTGSMMRGFVMSLIYVLGIVITYSLLGVIAGATGAAFGTVAEHPAVIIAVVLIFLLLAASMFGAFELQLPSGLLGKMSFGMKSKGFLAPLLLGLVLGFIAAPCVGPILIAILTYIAKAQSVFYGFWLMFFFALGMGVLFVILGTFSGALNRLPRSGVWMLTVKKIFGSIMIVMAIYFARPLIPSLIYRYVVAIAFIIFSTFAGAFTRLCDKPSIWDNIKKVIAVITAVIGIYGLVTNMMSSGFFMQSKGGGLTAVKTEGIAWITSYDRALAKAKSENKLLMIDFYAENCPACIEMDRYTFYNPEVIDKSKQFVAVKIYSADNKDIVKKYGIIGYPAVIFARPDGTQTGNTNYGYIKSDKFVDLMTSALKKF